MTVGVIAGLTFYAAIAHPLAWYEVLSYGAFYAVLDYAFNVIRLRLKPEPR